MSVKIIGAENLIKELDRRTKKINKDKIKQALLKSGDKLESEAGKLVPVDTGNLKKSIVGRSQGMSYVVDVNESYAGYVEKGTRYMKAQPFLEPAYNKAKEQFKNEMRELIE